MILTSVIVNNQLTAPSLTVRSAALTAFQSPPASSNQKPTAPALATRGAVSTNPPVICRFLSSTSREKLAAPSSDIRGIGQARPLIASADATSNTNDAQLFASRIPRPSLKRPFSPGEGSRSSAPTTGAPLKRANLSASVSASGGALDTEKNRLTRAMLSHIVERG